MGDQKEDRPKKRRQDILLLSGGSSRYSTVEDMLEAGRWDLYFLGKLWHHLWHNYKTNLKRLYEAKDIIALFFKLNI